MPSSILSSLREKRCNFNVEYLHRKLSELVEVKPVLQDHIPVIRRFTGGGTVIVDQNTIFVTMICNKDAVSNVQPFPRSIMSWSGLLYSEVFQGLADFHLRENGTLIESCINMPSTIFMLDVQRKFIVRGCLSVLHYL